MHMFNSHRPSTVTTEGLHGYLCSATGASFQWTGQIWEIFEDDAYTTHCDFGDGVNYWVYHITTD